MYKWHAAPVRTSQRCKSMSGLLSGCSAKRYRRQRSFIVLLQVWEVFPSSCCVDQSTALTWHSAENCTSTPASFRLYGLANKPGPCNGCLITQTWEQQQQQQDKEMSPNMNRKSTSTSVHPASSSLGLIRFCFCARNPAVRDFTAF